MVACCNRTICQTVCASHGNTLVYLKYRGPEAAPRGLGASLTSSGVRQKGGKTVHWLSDNDLANPVTDSRKGYVYTNVGRVALIF